MTRREPAKRELCENCVRCAIQRKGNPLDDNFNSQWLRVTANVDSCMPCK